MERINDLMNSARVMLPPFRPALVRTFFIIIGIIIGILLVYADLPLIGLEWRNADPVHLNDGDKDTWVKNAAVVYSRSDKSEGITNQIRTDLERAGYGPAEIEELIQANQSNPDVADALRQVQSLPSQEAADEQQGRIGTGFIANFIYPILCLVLIAVVLILLAVVLSLYPVRVGPWRRTEDAATSGLSEIQRERKRARDAAKAAAEAEATADEDLGEPIGRFMSAYVLGDDLYDDSFAIEPNGGYAGEAGIGILETIGIGDPRKVTAFSVEVFDQVEMQTKTLVLMSEHAYNDAALRDKLTPRGELALAKPGGTYWLETRHIKVRVTVISMEYGEGALPPNSFFQSMSLSLTIWLKEGAGSTEPVLPRIPDFDRPPAQPLAPPPMPPAQPAFNPPAGAPFQPPTGNVPPGQQPMPPQQPFPPQQRPLTGNVPPGQQPMPPQQPFPPQQRPLTGNVPPGQQPMPPQQRPVTGNIPPGQQPLPPQQPPQQRPPGQQPPVRPLPPQRPPQDDDPFGDTTNM